MLAVTPTDVNGVTWSSRSTFVAAATGTVSTASARSIAGSGDENADENEDAAFDS